MYRCQQRGHCINLESTVGDFEVALWKAVRSVLPTVDMRGYAFHWCQAVWWHVQELGL